MNRRSKTEALSIDFSLRPVMSLMVALIPVLLISAEFCKVSVIQTDAAQRGVDPKRTETQRSKKAPIPVLAISDSSITIIGSNNDMRSIIFSRVLPANVRDEDRYIITSTKADLFTEVEAILTAMQPSNGREIIVSSDARVKYAAIIGLMDSAMKAGFTDVSIAKLRT
ncbi:MAG TPA: biopolymer transporter ExbD [Chitinispirillaceae bacterium]|nr:biopolymer transporter ExbD [Chitinispirillaceae bacterium]